MTKSQNRLKGHLMFLPALLLFTTAHATVTNLVWYRLGDNDPGSVNGAVVNSAAVDLMGVRNLSQGGSPVYTNDVSLASGKIGSALAVQFNGVNQTYRGATFTPVQDNFGIEVWVRTMTTTPSTNAIAHNGDTTANGWGLVAIVGQLGVTAYRAEFGGGTLFGSGAPHAPGAWTHVAMVRDNGTSTFYLNGTASGSTSTATPIAPSGAFAIGATPQLPQSAYFPGMIDEVRVFTFAPGQFSPNDLLVNQQLAATLSESDVTSTSATLNGTASSFGFPTGAWFEWGTTTNLGNVTPAQALGNGAVNTNFSDNLTGLSVGSYYFRAVTTNKLGTVFGNTRSFAIGPVVQTLPATNVVVRAAILNGSVNPSGSDSTVWFEWGKTTNYGNVTPPQAMGNGFDALGFSQTITNTTSGLGIHYRAAASNSIGVAYGRDESFTWSPNVLYTWAGTGDIAAWIRSFGAANTAATLANTTPGELTIIETSSAAGGSQAFSDGSFRVRESLTQSAGGLDLTGWDFLEFDLGHNGAGDIPVQFFVQASTNFTFVPLGPDQMVSPGGVTTFRVPLSGLTPDESVYVRTIGMHVQDHTALGNVSWTLREVRAVGSPFTTRDLVTFDNGTAEGGLQGAIVSFDNASVKDNNGGQNQSGLSHNPAGSGSLQWTDLGGGSGGAISWGNGTAWNGNTFNNRITDLSNFDSMLVRMSAAGLDSEISVQGFFQMNNFSLFQSAGIELLPSDGQFHDLTFSLAGLTNMNVVDQTGINLGGHANELVINVDLVRFEIAPLRILSVETLGSDVVIHFNTSLGQQYQLEYSPDLSPGSWIEIGDIIFGDGQETIATDSGALLAADHRYYRIQQLP